MGFRRDARCRGCGSWSPILPAPSRVRSQAGLFAAWVVVGVGLKSWTMKLLSNLETQFLLPWERRASGRSRVLPAEQSLHWLLGKHSSISPVPMTVADETHVMWKIFGVFFSNSCCLCAEDMEEKGLDLLSKPFPIIVMFLSKNPSIPRKMPINQRK